MHYNWFIMQTILSASSKNYDFSLIVLTKSIYMIQLWCLNVLPIDFLNVIVKKKLKKYFWSLLVILVNILLKSAMKQIFWPWYFAQSNWISHIPCYKQHFRPHFFDKKAQCHPISILTIVSHQTLGNLPTVYRKSIYFLTPVFLPYLIDTKTNYVEFLT